MKENQYLVLGYSKYTNKEGRVGTTLYLSTPFSSWESSSNECIGFKGVQEFTYAELPSIKPNDVIEISWAKGYQGKAVIQGVTVVATAK